MSFSSQGVELGLVLKSKNSPIKRKVTIKHDVKLGGKIGWLERKRRKSKVLDLLIVLKLLNL